MSRNRAAWILEARSKPLVVRDAPFPTPGKDEIVIKTACVAINPVDYKLQDWDFMGLQYPAILGCEAAGEVVAVGEKVLGFQMGDRVIGDYKNAGFQEYTTVPSILTARIPATMAFSAAIVLPVAISTASAALFGPDNLGLTPPQATVPDPSTPDARNSASSEAEFTILVWGGSTSVGLAAIQLARAAGLRVVSTASKNNFDLCKAVGAEHVFDRNNESAVDEIVTAMRGRAFVGAFNAAGTKDALQSCIDVLIRTESTKVVANTLPVEEGMDLKGIRVNFFHALSILQNGLASKVWSEFLPQALQSGTLIPKPDTRIVGHGLEEIQKGLDEARKGYSGCKLVVTL